MDNKILINALVKKGLLIQEIGVKLLREAAVTEKSVEDIIYQRRMVDEIKLAETKSELLKIPYKKIPVEEISDELLPIIPEVTARTYKIVPLSKSRDLFVVGMLNPDDPRAQDALKFIAKQQKVNLGVYIVAPSDIEAVMRKYAPYKSEVEAAVRSMQGKGLAFSEAQRIVRLEEGANISEEAPIIRIVKRTIEEGVQLRASDIHIEPQRERLRIRLRIDGDLQEISSTPIELAQPIVSRVKILSNLKIDETRIPQDGRFRSIVFGKDIDFRVATFPTPVGEKAVLRILDPTVGLRGLEKLGVSEHNLSIINGGLARPFGMILVTGPTGSGKTTTLYSMLQNLNKEDVNIVSLEDPVEYFIDGLNQSQVKPEIGYDFGSGLRQILRQDPDIIMVGEIRDNETAALAVHAALTGHIVLSTLHTNNSLGVIPRLIDMKVEGFLLSSALNLMTAQRLLSMLCQNCKQAEEAPQELQGLITGELAKLPEKTRKTLTFKAPYKIYHGKGCKVCKDKGFVGRLGIHEILQMTPELQEIVNVGASEAKILLEARRQGLVSLRQDGIIKALNGLLSIEEVLRETAEV